MTRASGAFHKASNDADQQFSNSTRATQNVSGLGNTVLILSSNVVMPAALPTAKAAKLDNFPNALSAYNVCLTLENKATSDESRIHARILGYLILSAPSSAALTDVVKAIHSCAQDEMTLLELGKCFRLWFILPCRFYISFVRRERI